MSKNVTLQLTTRPRRIKDFIPRAQNRTTVPGIDAGGLIGGGGTYSDYYGPMGGIGPSGLPICEPVQMDVRVYNCNEPIHRDRSDHTLGGAYVVSVRKIIKNRTNPIETPFSVQMIYGQGNGASWNPLDRRNDLTTALFNRWEMVIDEQRIFNHFRVDPCVTAIEINPIFVYGGPINLADCILRLYEVAPSAGGYVTGGFPLPPNTQPPFDFDGDLIGEMHLVPGQMRRDYSFTFQPQGILEWDEIDQKFWRFFTIALRNESDFGTEDANPGAPIRVGYLDDRRPFPEGNPADYPPEEQIDLAHRYDSAPNVLVGDWPDTGLDQFVSYLYEADDGQTEATPGTWGLSEFDSETEWNGNQIPDGTWNIAVADGYGKMSTSTDGSFNFSDQWLHLTNVYNWPDPARPFDFTVRLKGIFPETTPDSQAGFFIWFSKYNGLFNGSPNSNPLADELMFQMWFSDLDGPFGLEGGGSNFAFARHDTTLSQSFFEWDSTDFPQFNGLREPDFYVRQRLEADSFRMKIWLATDNEPDWQFVETGLDFPSLNWDFILCEGLVSLQDGVTSTWQTLFDEITINEGYGEVKTETFGRGTCTDGRLIRDVYFDGLLAEKDQYEIVNNSVIPTEPLPEGTEVTIGVYP